MTHDGLAQGEPPEAGIGVKVVGALAREVMLLDIVQVLYSMSYLDESVAE